MRTALAALLALLATVGGEAATPGPVGWRLAREVDGVVAWTAETQDEFWGYARGRVQAPPDAIFDRIGNFESLPAVYPWLDRVQVLERGDHTALVYFHYDLPWPLSDRSYTARHRWHTDPGGTIVLDVEEENGASPPADGAVHVENVLAQIVLAPVDGGAASDVGYLFRADLAGMLPRTVRAQTAWKVPLNVVLSMRTSLEPRFAHR